MRLSDLTSPVFLLHLSIRRRKDGFFVESIDYQTLFLYLNKEDHYVYPTGQN